MNLPKRLGLLSTTLALLMLLFVTPRGHAQEGGGTLAFDVPGPGEPSATVNLLTTGFIDAQLFITTAEFQIIRSESEDFLPTQVIGQYCVQISNPDFSVGPRDELALNVQAVDNSGETTNPRVANLRIGVLDTNKPGGTVPSNDPSCFVKRNQSPLAVLNVPTTVNDTDRRNGEIVTLDGSASSDADGKIVNYEFFTHDGQLLASGPDPVVDVFLPDGENVITLVVTDDSVPNPVFQPTATKPSAALRSSGSVRTVSFNRSTGGKPSSARSGKSGFSNYEGSSSATAETTETVVVNPVRPVADPGKYAPFPDTDGKPGETVTLDGSASIVPLDEGIESTFNWFLLGNESRTPIGSGTVIRPRLPDGESQIRLEITIVDNNRERSQVVTGDTDVLVIAPRPVIANAGGDRSVPDSDNQMGEVVRLDASGSQVPSEAQVTYEWFLNPNLEGESFGTSLGTGLVIMPRLDDGANTILLRVTVQGQGYGCGEYGSKGSRTTSNRSFEGYEGGCFQQEDIDIITVTVQPPAPQAPNVVPVVTIRPTEIVIDTDSLDGEEVTLDGTASTIPPGVQATFEWFKNPGSETNGTSLGTGAIIKPRLDNGMTRIRLVITANGFPFFADATVTVNPPAAVVAVPGNYAPKTDTDGFPGEVFPLNASGSRIPAGAMATFQWFRDPSGESNGVALGTGMSITPRLKDGTTVVRLVVTVNQVVSIGDTTVTVGSPGQAAVLAELPNLTPNQRRVATALDDVCTRLIGLSSGLNGPANPGDRMTGSEASFTADQADLANKCRGIAINNTVDNQVEAVVDLTPDDFAVARTQALLFANTQYASVLDRLIALRGGARGLSLAGLQIQVDGNTVPLAVLQDMFGKIFGSGASADDEPGGLLSDRWGMWVRGNYSTGGRDKSLVSPSFDADQAGIVIGTDYRLTNNSVIGASIAYLDSQIDFNPLREGSLDTSSMALSLYGSMYAGKNFYLDALANVAKADYDARRNISFNQGSGLVPVDVDAAGGTDGLTLSAGLSGGYDFLFKGVTISPNAGFFYVDATIDSFAEDGAGGFNLLYDEQNFESLTGNIGLRLTSTLNLPWVVLVPGLRVDYVREFKDDTEVFQVRFAADPNGMSSAPITIQTDNPDTSYWRASLNVSAQFKLGFAGYVEYQRIGGFSQIDFSDLAFGFRMQRSF